MNTMNNMETQQLNRMILIAFESLKLILKGSRTRAAEPEWHKQVEDGINKVEVELKDLMDEVENDETSMWKASLVLERLIGRMLDLEAEVEQLVKKVGGK